MRFFIGLTFVAGFLLVFGLNLLYSEVRTERERKRRSQMRLESRSRQVERAKVAVENRDLYELASQSSLEHHSPPLSEKIELYFEQAGIRSSPTRLLSLQIILAALVSLMAGLAANNLITAVFAGSICLILPFLYISKIRANRLEKLLSQLPDAFDLISRMMRAGQPFTQAMQVTSHEADTPLSEEFGYCVDQQRLGLSADAALRDLARRTGLLEVRIFVLAVLIQRQTGGNLADLLENLATIIRDRYRIRGVITALTAEGRAQAYVLLALPIVILIGMTLLNPEYMSELYSRPWLISTTGLAMILGALWMRRIVNFNF